MLPALGYVWVGCEGMQTLYGRQEKKGRGGGGVGAHHPGGPSVTDQNLQARVCLAARDLHRVVTAAAGRKTSVLPLAAAQLGSARMQPGGTQLAPDPLAAGAAGTRC